MPIMDPLKIAIQFLVKYHIFLGSSHCVMLWRKYFNVSSSEKDGCVSCRVPHDPKYKGWYYVWVSVTVCCSAINISDQAYSYNRSVKNRDSVPGQIPYFLGLLALCYAVENIF